MSFPLGDKGEVRRVSEYRGKEKVFSSRLGAAVGHLISRMSLHVPVKEEIE